MAGYSDRAHVVGEGEARCLRSFTGEKLSVNYCTVNYRKSHVKNAGLSNGHVKKMGIVKIFEYVNVKGTTYFRDDCLELPI